MRRALLAALLAVPSLATAEDTVTLLRRGPLVLLEETRGVLDGATSLTLVDAPPEDVWAVVREPATWSLFMPRMTKSDLVKEEGAVVDVHFEIDNPGPDTSYTARWRRDEEKRELAGEQVDGDLQGSRWLLRLEPTAGGKKTILHHKVRIRNFSSFVASIEDESKTITMGVNVGSAVAGARALAARAEQRARKAGR